MRACKYNQAQAPPQNGLCVSVALFQLEKLELVSVLWRIANQSTMEVKPCLLRARCLFTGHASCSLAESSPIGL